MLCQHCKCSQPNTHNQTEGLIKGRGRHDVPKPGLVVSVGLGTVKARGIAVFRSSPILQNLHTLHWIHGYMFSDTAHPLTFLAVDSFVCSCTMTLVSTDQVFTTSSKLTWRTGTLVNLCRDHKPEKSKK